jgi:hypothetical protein
MGWAGYPTLRLMTLVETGTRGLLGATLGSAGDRDEATQARRLLPLLRPGMLLLLDRGFDGSAFFADVARTGAMLLARIKSTRNPPVLTHLPDGSYLSCMDGLTVRIIEADLSITGADGSRVQDRYRLVTTLLDHHRVPAADLVQLYHERWEIESAYLALRHTLLDGHVLRSGDRPGLEQEVWALLTLYQLLRMTMVTAVETRPGTKPRPGQLHHRPRGRTGRAHRSPRDLSRRTRRPARRHRSGGAGHTATRAPRPLQRPQGQVFHLPLPQPRRRPTRHRNRHHRHRHHRHHPTHRPASSPVPPRPQHASPARASHPPAPHCGDHDH